MPITSVMRKTIDAGTRQQREKPRGSRDVRTHVIVAG